ncbi:cupin domain-containing protein [Actinomadura flavalba]|uniref:cupin domain-containing protein n=1 Tax=Actinomadura flavalba TaxID=1120938 RepID=UPI00036DF7F3|nr:cupin domain-containing protein [Actinomadura flavalba]
MLRLLSWAVFATAFGVTLTAGPTGAYAGSTGVTARTLARTTIGSRDLVLREIVIEPGGSTGWHYHDGTLTALVKEGTLTRTLADCTTLTHPRGTVVEEPSGAAHPHEGRNLGPRPVVLHALYTVPRGLPLAREAPAPSCAET